MARPHVRAVPEPALPVPTPLPPTPSADAALGSALVRPPADLEVAIPAFNEAGRLPETLPQTVEFLSEQPWSSRVVVVDNGSHDGTAEIARAVAEDSDGAVPVEVLGCARPGKGAAVRRALLSSRSRFVGFFDADLATPLKTLTAAMTHLEAGAAAVIASRHSPGAHLVQVQPRCRRLGGAAFRLLTRSMVKGVRDTQCGFKFFRREPVLHALVGCRTNGFAFDIELLQRLQCLGEPIVELPVDWCDVGQSTFRPVRDGLASFGAVLSMSRPTPGASW